MALPYKSLADLPDAIKKLPTGAQQIFKSAFNASFNKYGEERAFKIAWASVKNKFKKVKGKWEKKSMDEVKSVNAGIIVGQEHEHHFDNRCLPLSRVVESKKVELDGDTALWVKTKFNRAHPNFEVAKSSILDKYLTHFSIEYIPEEEKAYQFNIPEVGDIRVLDGFDWTGLTFTGKPVNPDASLTNCYEDENGDFYAEGYAIVGSIDRVNDFISDEAIENANSQVQEFLGMKSFDSGIDVNFDIEELKAKWTRAFINDLPDSAFAFISPGGKKDDEGKTIPRSLRHLPYMDKSGKVDLPHLRNALARLPQTDIPADAKKKAMAKLNAVAKKSDVGVSKDKEKEGKKSMTEETTDTSSNEEVEDAETRETEATKEVQQKEGEKKKAEEKAEENTEEKAEEKTEEKAEDVETLKEEVKALKKTLEELKGVKRDVKNAQPAQKLVKPQGDKFKEEEIKGHYDRTYRTILKSKGVR